MIRAFLRQGLLAMMLAAAAISAVPVSAQMFTQGYKFLKAVKDKDGNEATKLLNAPGSTVVNAQDYTTGQTGLYIATQRRDLTWIKFLTQEGADPNIADKKGVTPLMVAVRQNFPAGAEALIKAGADVDVTDSTGQTPLINAVLAHNYPMMRVLLEGGANPNRYDNSGRSARDYAMLDGKDSVAMQTIEKYAKKSDSGNSDQSSGTYGPPA